MITFKTTCRKHSKNTNIGTKLIAGIKLVTAQYSDLCQVLKEQVQVQVPKVQVQVQVAYQYLG